MNNIHKKIIVIGECEIPPIPPVEVCPVKANIIEACDSDNTIILNSGSTIFNKTLITNNISIGGKITSYNNENINGKILVGGGNGFELFDLPVFPTIPTKTSDLINDGSDGINPFITANDIPSIEGFVPLSGTTDPIYGNLQFTNIDEPSYLYSGELSGNSQGIRTWFDDQSIEIFRKVDGIDSAIFSLGNGEANLNFANAGKGMVGNTVYDKQGDPNAFAQIFDIENAISGSAISLTTIGITGASTLLMGILNIPNYGIYAENLFNTPVSSTQKGIVDNISLQELGGVDKTINNIRIGKGNNNLANNVVIGGVTSLSVVTTGNFNTAIGDNTLPTNTTGQVNLAVGASALAVNTTGSFNTAVGVAALSSSVSSSNHTAVGASALRNINSGAFDGNTAIGANALLNKTSGGASTAIGQGALSRETTGSSNIGIGRNAGAGITTGTMNIHIGQMGAPTQGITTGSRNIIFRTDNTTHGISTGSGNTLIGLATLANTDNNVQISDGASNIALRKLADNTLLAPTQTNTLIDADSTGKAIVTKEYLNTKIVTPQITITGNTTIDNTFNNSIVKVKANAIINIPSTLMDNFSCVFRTFTGFTATFTPISVTMDAPKGLVLQPLKMATLFKDGAINTFILEGELST